MQKAEGEMMGRQAKFKLLTKRNGLCDNQKDGDKNNYGIIAKKETEEEVKRQFYYTGDY